MIFVFKQTSTTVLSYHETQLFLTVVCNNFGKQHLSENSPMVDSGVQGQQPMWSFNFEGCLFHAVLPHQAFATGESCCYVKLLSSLYVT